MSKPWKSWTDDELADNAERGLTGHAAVEMMRRLRDSNNKLAKVNLALTVAGFLVAIAGSFVAILQFRGVKAVAP